MRPSILAAVLVLLAACGDSSSRALTFAWPPKVGERYPDVTLRGLDGEPVSLASFEGRVLLIEPVGMT